MKKLVAISILAALALCVFSAAAMADATNWVMQLKASNLGGKESGATLSLGWRSGYTDDIDTGEVAPIPDPPPGGRLAYIVSRLDDNTVSKLDYRSSFENTVGYFQSWTLEAFYKGVSPVDGILISVTETSAKYDYAAGPLVIKWGEAADQQRIFTAENPFTAFSFTLPGDTPITSPAIVTVTCGVVPEPSSMMALASGLVGMAGFAIRRRR